MAWLCSSKINRQSLEIPSRPHYDYGNNCFTKCSNLSFSSAEINQENFNDQTVRFTMKVQKLANTEGVLLQTSVH